MGTMNNGIWEHDYVYVVACRLRQMLERETAARVVMTLEDLETGCRPSTADKLVANRQGTILTSPPFLAKKDGEARIGVNLRWYLANSIYHRAQKDGLDPDKVVFISLHADARHASLRGVMVYVPGAGYRTKTYGSSAASYQKYREVREKTHVRFSKQQRVRSEAVSRKLAVSIVESYRRAGLPVQPYQPIRDKVIRGKSEWVPAVLRGNAVPNKVLVEMVNLSNPKDAAVLGSARKRERLAHGLVEALFDYFGERPRNVAAVGVTAD
jgi:N-acetylmuramoyl-L-alanine amidase